jgi:hypothetical protein
MTTTTTTTEWTEELLITEEELFEATKRSGWNLRPGLGAAH